MLLLMFWLGGFICLEGCLFENEYQKNHSVKEFWYSMLRYTIMGLFWPVVIPMGIFEMLTKGE